jgi:hypothetical protein
MIRFSHPGRQVPDDSRGPRKAAIRDGVDERGGMSYFQK